MQWGESIEALDLDKRACSPVEQNPQHIWRSCIRTPRCKAVEHVKAFHIRGQGVCFGRQEPLENLWVRRTLSAKHERVVATTSIVEVSGRDISFGLNKAGTCSAWLAAVRAPPKVPANTSRICMVKSSDGGATAFRAARRSAGVISSVVAAFGWLLSGTDSMEAWA